MNFLSNFLFMSSIGVVIFHLIGVGAKTNLVPMPVVLVTLALFVASLMLGNQNGN
jgi:hypothetical protein